MKRRLAIVGAGWAGLAAAVRAVQAGHRVVLYEMAARPGGRARSVERDDDSGDQALDNGQHILIGAYRSTLALMRTVGADPDALLARLPLTLRQPGRHGLVLPPGRPVPAFVRAVLANRDWPWRDRVRLLMTAATWAAQGFRSTPDRSVAALARRLPSRVRDDLIEPLCVAALNTPSHEASAAVMLRVLRDALFGGPGGADLLLPRAPLGRLLPEPAWGWLAAHGAERRAGARVTTLARDGDGWRLDDRPFERVILACPAAEASRLASSIAPDWARQAAALRYEPIVTAYAEAGNVRLPDPMTALRADDTQAPAQFVFDLGQLGRAPGRLAFVVSGAAPWVAAGRDALQAALQRQAAAAWPTASWPKQLRWRHLLVEKRATFRCTPALRRPGLHIAPGLLAAGDYVAGPYPATLEGAVRSGEAAADAC